MGYTKLRGKRQANTQRITKRQWVNPSSSLARVFNLPSQPGQIHHPCIAHHEYRTPPQFSYSPVFQINHSCLTLTCNQICLVQSHQESGCEGYIYIYIYICAREPVDISRETLGVGLVSLIRATFFFFGPPWCIGSRQTSVKP